MRASDAPADDPLGEPTTLDRSRVDRLETTEGGQRSPATYVSYASNGAGSGDRGLEAELEYQSTLARLALVDEPCPVLVGHDGRYAIRRLIGRGAMGAVYYADDLALRRPVAVKLVAAHGRDRERFQDRLRREAWALALLDHPNVLQVYDVDVARSGELFIIMQYVPGRTLRDWAAATSPGRAELLAVFAEAGRGLAAAHAKGLVHRDFKPDNVLVHEQDGERRVLVADFGLAGGGPLRARSVAATPASRAALTSAGLLGTPAYMAPEQRRGEAVDARSDQFAYCVSLWELLVGERPTPELPGPRPRALPRWLQRLLLRGMREHPGERHRDMLALVEALERTPSRRRRTASFAAAAGSGGAAALLASLLTAGPELPARAAVDECLDAGAEPATIWTRARARELEQRLRSREVEPVEPVLAAIADAVERWDTNRTRACEPGTPPQQRAQIARCVERLDHWIELIATRGAEAPELLPNLLESLRTDEFCQATPQPLDPQVRASLDAAADAELLADFEDAEAHGERAISLAQSVDSCVADGGYSHEYAAAAYRLGHIHGEQNNGPEALKWLADAATHAIACTDDWTFVRARLRAARNAAVDLDDAERADSLLRDVEPIFARNAAAAWPAELAWERRLTEGLVELAADRPEQAQRSFEAALERVDEGSPLERAETLLNLGVAANARGELDRARAAFERAEREFGANYGASPPELDLARLNLGLALLEQAQTDAAVELLERAAASRHVRVAIAGQTALLQIYVELPEQRERARALAPELAALVRSNPDQLAYDRALALLWAGQVMADGGDAAGLAALAEALAIFEAQSPNDEDRDTCELSLAQNAFELGQLELAREHAEALLRRSQDNSWGDYARNLLREIDDKKSP